MDVVCSVCRNLPPVARGKCMTCYQYFRRNGIDRPEGRARRQALLNYRREVREQERAVDRRRTTPEDRLERFLAKVNDGKRPRPDECWPWTGSVSEIGYGCVGRSGRRYLAHRVSYETFVGPIPPGLVIDHLCSVRHCVNPRHLEAVTQAENNRRMRERRWSA